MNNLFHWSDQAWLAIDQVGILTGHMMFLVALGGGALAVTKRSAIRRWLWRNRFPKVGPRGDVQQDWDGLLFTVSNSDLPEWVLSHGGHA